MSKTHWKKFTNPDFLGAYALDPEEDTIVTITKVGKETFTGNGGKKDEGMVIHFEGDYKPLICNSTNAKAISKALGTAYIEEWKGKPIALYIDQVSAFGETVDAVRVRPYKPKVAELFCTDCGEPIKAAFNMSPKALAKYTQEKYGQMLCDKCATLRAKGEGNGTE